MLNNLTPDANVNTTEIVFENKQLKINSFAEFTFDDKLSVYLGLKSDINNIVTYGKKVEKKSISKIFLKNIEDTIYLENESHTIPKYNYTIII